MTQYNKATICLNGHVLSSSTKNYLKYCKQCGSETMSTCPSCKNYIHGEPVVEFPWLLGEYIPPSYCHECSNPYPWTSQVLENAIELIALDDDIPKEHKEIIKLALPDIITETPTTPVAVAKYKKFMSVAADYTKNGMKNLLIDVISDTVKKSMFG